MSVRESEVSSNEEEGSDPHFGERLRGGWKFSRVDYSSLDGSIRDKTNRVSVDKSLDLCSHCKVV